MTDREFVCSQCGAPLTFDPGSNALKCGNCGHGNQLVNRAAAAVEQDFEKFLRAARERAPMVTEQSVRCGACGAETLVAAHIKSTRCPFCDSPLVTQADSRALIKPQGLLPFRVSRSQAVESFQSWVKGLWFAPSKLKAYARTKSSQLKGIYVPYWTFDSHTRSEYVGARGDDYYTTESRTVTVGGRRETRQQQVRHTRWTPVSGVSHNAFDDVLVMASNAVPREHADALEPWDLSAAVAPEDKYLAGFQTEVYRVDLERGFGYAREKMDRAIRAAIGREIGGDHQRIVSVSTRHDGVTFKHLLLPIWISAYHYGQQTYRFLINGRSGQVRGERPYSWIKIAAAVLAGALAIAAGYWAINYFHLLQ